MGDQVFPKKIAMVWFQGESNIPKTIFKENLRNWRLLNPDWQVDLLDETRLRQICKDYSEECVKTFDSFDLLHMKVDFARYVSLYSEYTMYVDMDMFALRSLSNSDVILKLIDKYKFGHFVGLSTVNINPIESVLFSGFKKCINNAMMITSPRNPVIKELVDTIIRENSDKEQDLRSNYYRIQNITGPLFVNRFFKPYLQKKSKVVIELFPYYIFEPTQPFGDADIQESTIAIHKFEMSWISSDLKNVMRMYFKFKPFLIVIPFIFLVYLVTKRRN